VTETEHVTFIIIMGQWAISIGSNSYMYVAVEPDRIDDGYVAFERHDGDVVTGHDEKIPERHPRQPDVTSELVENALRRHTSPVQLDSGNEQSEPGRTQVDHALVHDQNVHRLNKRLHVYKKQGRF